MKNLILAFFTITIILVFGTIAFGEDYIGSKPPSFDAIAQQVKDFYNCASVHEIGRVKDDASTYSVFFGCLIPNTDTDQVTKIVLKKLDTKRWLLVFPSGMADYTLTIEK